MKKIILLGSLTLILASCSNTNHKEKETKFEFIDNIQLENNNTDNNTIDNKPKIIEKGRD